MMLTVRIILVAFGLFLIFDSLFLHLITFNYGMIDLSWLDPYFSHFYIGAGLMLAGLFLPSGQKIK